MTTKKFLKKKNKIIKDATGLTLIPSSQIVKTSKVRLEETSKLTIRNCPYCMLYSYQSCTECPMAIADNNCLTNVKSTYSDANKKWIYSATAKDRQKLIKLIRKYNKGI